jgi:prevent-host-death family protein
MKKTSISILKAHLSRYLDAVKAGEEVIVTERGRPVARLTGVMDPAAPTARVAQLLREGRMRGPLDAAPADLPEGELPQDPEGRARRYLLEERSEGR